MSTKLFGTSDHFKGVHYVCCPNISRCEAGKTAGLRTGSRGFHVLSPPVPGQGETRLPQFCLEPQAPLVSCFSFLLALATTQKASPLNTHHCMYVLISVVFGGILAPHSPCSCCALCNPHSAVTPPSTPSHICLSQNVLSASSP